MSERHPRLERQLRNVGASDRSGVLEPKALRELLAAVSRAYHDADADRAALDEREASLAAATEELRSLREVRRSKDWLTGIGPGIREPLRELVDGVDLLLEADPVYVDRSGLESLRRAAGSVLASLDDVVDYAEMEAGTLEIDSIPFDLRPAVEDVAAAVAPLAEAKGLELVVRYDPAAPRYVVGDPGRIRQVLSTLVRHSVATTREGWVLVDVSCERSTEADAILRFAIEDSGQGNARQELRRAFEAAAPPPALLAGPDALGLAVASRLVRLLGGRVGTRQDAGLWSALWFELALPLDQEAPADLRVGTLRDVRVMIVDASAARRRALEDQLAHWEMRCEGFESGAEALRELRQAIDDDDPFRAAILGTRIGGMDAQLFGDLVKSDAALRDVELVLLTAIGEKGMAKRLREIGFSAYLVKPIREAPLKETLQCVLGARRRGLGQTLLTRHSLTESGILEPTESPPPREELAKRR